MRDMKKSIRRSAGVLIASTLFATPIQLHANSFTPEALVAAYEGYVFPSPDDHLIKPQQSSLTTISVHCVKSEFCDVIIPELKKYLKASWLKIEEVNEFNSDATTSIEISYGFKVATERQSAQEIERINIKLRPSEELYKEGDDNCLGIHVRQGQLITHTVVFANLLGSKERYVSCIMLGLAYGLGLKLSPTYNQAWTEAGGLDKATDSEFSQFMRGTGRLIALHTNSQTHSGETKEEFERQLSGQNLVQLLGEE